MKFMLRAIGVEVRMKATQQLKDEHESVKVMLGILGHVYRKLESTGSLNIEHFEKILEFLKVFVDKCHHGKEEELFFPALETAGIPKDGPIAVMLYEHEMGRKYIRAMSDAFAQYLKKNKSAAANISQHAKNYIDLLMAHIEAENNVLFAMADSRLSQKTQNELFSGFEKIEELQIGAGKHEEFHALLTKLGGIYPNR
jgi:hemerythrin-like domain-containing protein